MRCGRAQGRFAEAAKSCIGCAFSSVSMSIQYYTDEDRKMYLPYRDTSKGTEFSHDMHSCHRTVTRKGSKRAHQGFRLHLHWPLPRTRQLPKSKWAWTFQLGYIILQISLARHQVEAAGLFKSTCSCAFTMMPFAVVPRQSDTAATRQ